MNFFDAAGFADRERIHSQCLFWFFTLDPRIAPDRVKSRALSVLLGRPRQSYADFKAYTETVHIDIIITTGTLVVVIENKLKSSQHDRPTVTYDAAFQKLCKDDPERFQRAKTEKVLLSLINEAPESPEWQAITYHRVYKALSGALPNIKGPDAVILGEYLKSLRVLLESYDYFIQNYREFPRIFAPLGKRADMETNDRIAYIENFGLGVLFQRGFFINIIERIQPLYGKKFKWTIDVTQQVALLQLIYKKYAVKGNRYFLGLQYQGGSFKINFQHEDYWNSGKTEEGFVRGVPAFEGYIKTGGRNGYIRLNRPQRYAYISVSKTHGLDLFDEKDFTALCGRFREEIDQALPVMGDIKKRLDTLVL
jgi:hypothetical protein